MTPDTKICPECRNPDGSINADYCAENGQCVFGCGTSIDEDMGICPSCQDHSANETVCETCDTRYAKWGETWEVVT